MPRSSPAPKAEAWPCSSENVTSPHSHNRSLLRPSALHNAAVPGICKVCGILKKCTLLRCPPSTLVLVQSYRWILLDEVEINSVAEQLANVRDAVFNHGWPLQAQTETEDPHVFRQTHGLGHVLATSSLNLH
ncbi:hypothetical protein L209DRAFT_229006 [Thermothelomyces heterothallicus CBS 203.75]